MEVAGKTGERAGAHCRMAGGVVSWREGRACCLGRREFRAECLSLELFRSRAPKRRSCHRSVAAPNEVRPHSSLDCLNV
jgi:hypothetical protein